MHYCKCVYFKGSAATSVQEETQYYELPVKNGKVSVHSKLDAQGQNERVSWNANPKVGSLDNIYHQPRWRTSIEISIKSVFWVQLAFILALLISFCPRWDTCRNFTFSHQIWTLQSPVTEVDLGQYVPDWFPWPRTSQAPWWRGSHPDSPWEATSPVQDRFSSKHTPPTCGYRQKGISASYHPPRKLSEGNVFSCVHLSVCL